MIRILDLEDEGHLFSISGQIEFDIFYDRITHLVDYYNYSMKCYYTFLDQKHQEKKKTKDNINELLKSADDQDIYVTEGDIIFTLDEEFLGIEMNYQEFHKMTLIIILFSEAEKLIDNLYKLHQQVGNIKKINVKINEKLKNLCIERGVDEEDRNQILDDYNNLRLIRNKLVHRYDHWDNELIINGLSYRGVNQLNEEILENFVNSIINSIQKIEEYF